MGQTDHNLAEARHQQCCGDKLPESQGNIIAIEPGKYQIVTTLM